MSPPRQVQILLHHRPHTIHHRILLVSLNIPPFAHHRMPHHLLLSPPGVLVTLHHSFPLRARRLLQVSVGRRQRNQSSLILNLGLGPKMRKDLHVDGPFDQEKQINSSRIGSTVYSTSDSCEEIPMQWWLR